MECPRDHTELTVESFKDIEVDRCPVCKGMWLDPGELDQLEDTVFDQDEIKGSTMYRSYQGELPCPKCQVPMHLFHYRAYDLELDFCQEEHGVWLDGNEEKRVLDLMKQRIKDLDRSAAAESEWAGMLKRFKSKSFGKGLGGFFRRR